MKKISICLLLATLIFSNGQCQRSEKPIRYFGEPIMTDTTSTIFFPTRYNDEFLSANKITIWGDYYANFFVYDFVNDTYKKLFDQDTYIESFRNGNYYGSGTNIKPKNVVANLVFMVVKKNDYNGSGRIDDKDPSLLFVSTSTGKNLKQITYENENVISFEIFEKQGFALVRIQVDEDNDKSFKADKIFFRKINLKDFSMGKKIEIM